jgi:ureidoglycolate hydrolase
MAETERAIRVLELTTDAFRPYGDVIWPRRGAGQFEPNPYDPETSPTEARLVLDQGTPRLSIMHLRLVGVAFRQLARHMRVTQCLGSASGADWYIGVAAPDPARRDVGLDGIVGFHIPAGAVIKLGIGTWHAGPLFLQEEGMFLNLENLDTNKRDFESADLPVLCRLAV